MQKNINRERGDWVKVIFAHVFAPFTFKVAQYLGQWAEYPLSERERGEQPPMDELPHPNPKTSKRESSPTEKATIIFTLFLTEIPSVLNKKLKSEIN